MSELALSLTDLDEPDNIPTIIDVQANTPPRHAPTTGGNDFSRIPYDDSSTLEKITDSNPVRIR